MFPRCNGTVPKGRNIGPERKGQTQHSRNSVGQTWSPKGPCQVSGAHNGIICTLKRLGGAPPFSTQRCSLELDPFSSCSFPQWTFHRQDISSILGSHCNLSVTSHIYTVTSRGSSGGCLTPTHFAWPQQSFGGLVQVSNLHSQPHGHPILFLSEIHTDTGC